LDLGVIKDGRFNGTDARSLLLKYRWRVDRPALLRQVGVRVGGPTAATVLGIAFHEQLGQLILSLSDGAQLLFDLEEEKPAPATEDKKGAGP
jgi:hypothetical protein